MEAARRQARQVKCNTNLRTLGTASLFYAKENRETLVRAEYAANLLAGEDPDSSLHYSQSLLYGLPYYDGKIPGLWRNELPLLNQQPLIRILEKIDLFQCPSFPESENSGEQVLDYLPNAFPIPYTAANVAYDGDGGGPGQQYNGSVNQDAVNSEKFFKLDRLDERIISPSRLIYLTETHAKMPTNDLRLHDVFLASQLPFGQYPRIASDKRHPRGVNTLFLDGSAHTMSLQQMDTGNTGQPGALGVRLRWFTSYLGETP